MFARSTTMGNAKASESGTSNSTALTLFYLLTYPQARKPAWRNRLNVQRFE